MDAPTVTTATCSPFSYVDDPSGIELRRALQLPQPPPCEVAAFDRTELLLAAAGGLTLLAGLLRAVFA